MRLYDTKLLTIICEAPAQKNITDILEKNNLSGYTFYEVGGNGSKGIRGQGLQNEKNIKLEVILQEEKLYRILEEIARTLFSDYAIVTYVNDVGVIRIEKFS
ncbi:conserved hypothetical protein [metagenome]